MFLRGRGPFPRGQPSGRHPAVPERLIERCPAPVPTSRTTATESSTDEGVTLSMALPIAKLASKLGGFLTASESSAPSLAVDTVAVDVFHELDNHGIGLPIQESRLIPPSVYPTLVTFKSHVLASPAAQTASNEYIATVRLRQGNMYRHPGAPVPLIPGPSADTMIQSVLTTITTDSTRTTLISMEMARWICTTGK